MRPRVRPTHLPGPFALVLPVAAAALTGLAGPALAQPTPPAPGEAVEAPPIAAGTVVIVSPTAPVIAAPGATPPTVAAPGEATPAPQTHAWSEVSHINGQLVKVGEQRDYLVATEKKTMIASNPIGWLFGLWGVSVSHAVTSNVAIRADGNLASVGSGSGYEVGLSLPIYFRQMFSGPFFEPGVLGRSMKDCDSCSEHLIAGPSMLIGWQWTYDSGLSLALAGGAVRDMGDHGGKVEPAGYFRIGYAM